MWNIIELTMKSQKLNIRSLALASGVPATTIYSWKSGKSSPTAEKLAKISKVLGVTVDYLMGRTDNPSVATLDTKMREIIEKHLPDYAPSKIQSVYDELSEENQNALLKFAEYLLFEQNKNRP